MESLAATPRWDLYSQAPLVNGLAMLENTFTMMHLGVNMWNDDGMAGFVLHAYNLVMQRNVLERPIPILERLCTMLHNAVFMGHRPTSNFRSALFRFLGGKIERHRDRQEREKTNRRLNLNADIGRSHVISGPTILPAALAEDRRIQPGKLSKLYDLRSAHYHFRAALQQDERAIKSIFFGPSTKEKRSDGNAQEKPVRASNDVHASDFDYDGENDWTHTGRELMRLVNRNLRGEIDKLTDNAFPLARVDPFAVYALLNDILSRVVDKMKQDLSEKELIECEMMRPTTNPRVAGTAGAVISAMMDVVDGEGKGGVKVKGPDGKQVLFKKGFRDFAKWVAEALVEATEGKDLPEQYMWKHI